MKRTVVTQSFEHDHISSPPGFPGSICLHGVFFTVLCLTGIYSSLLPHSPQKRVPIGLTVPHLEHFFCFREAPQLLQKLPWPEGLPHWGQVICLLSILPSNTTVLAAFCWISSTIFWDLAWTISTFMRGAHSTQRPSSSLKSDSQTHCLHLWHRWKCLFASFCAISKARSCSLCHSGDIPWNLSLKIFPPRSTLYPKLWAPSSEAPMEKPRDRPRKREPFL